MRKFDIVVASLLIAAGVVGIYIFLIGLEWIKIIPVGLEAVDKMFFILVGGGVILLVVSVGLLFYGALASKNTIEVG